MRWTRFFTRARRDADTAKEIASYIAIETDDNIARGMSPRAAHDAAVRKFGNATRVREDIYMMNSFNPIDSIWQDFKFAGRLLRRDKAFALAAIVSLALGIGANTAIFQLLDAVRLRALPVDDPGQLVEVRLPPGTSRWGSFSSRRPMVTFPHFEEIRRHQQVFASLFAWSSGELNTATGGEEQNVEALWASGDTFDTLGVSPVVGRLITPADDHPGCTPVAVLSHAYWQRAFGGSPSVLQQTVRLEGVRMDIVGVTEPSFFGLDVGRRFDVAVPLCADPLFNTTGRIESRSGWWLSVIGRLRPGVSESQATEHLRSISPAILKATLPEGNTQDGIDTILKSKFEAFPAGAGVSSLRSQFAQPLVVLLAATGLVLLIACANLANLLLARASARQKEIAVRMAIGASRRRIVGQLFVESVMLAFIGTMLGLLVARGLGALLLAQLAAGFGALFLDMSWNMQVFGFTALVSTIACLLFGLAPALKATALAPIVTLRVGGRGLTDGRERFGLRRALVVAQVALSLVLLLGALLFTRTLVNVMTIDAGFDQRVVAVRLTDDRLLGADLPRRLALREELRAEIAAIPGVQSAAISDYVPLSGSQWNEFVFTDAPVEKQLTNFTRVSADYFQTMGVPIVKGRLFSNADVPGSPPVAIVNEAFVAKFFPSADPLGHLLWIETGPDRPVEKFQIIGVARNTKYQGIKDRFEPMVHLAATQAADEGEWFRLVVRPRGAIEGVLPAITRRIAEVNPSIDVRLSVISQAVRDGLVRERLMAALSSAFGILAGLLAAVGLYGVMSYTVARRSNELGIRIALGAERSAVLIMVLREAAVLLTIGMVIGAALGLGAAKAAASLLFGLTPTDVPTITAALAMLALIGLGASFVPARRASRLDPARVLRDE